MLAAAAPAAAFSFPDLSSLLWDTITPDYTLNHGQTYDINGDNVRCTLEPRTIDGYSIWDAANILVNTEQQFFVTGDIKTFDNGRVMVRLRGTAVKSGLCSIDYKVVTPITTTPPATTTPPPNPITGAGALKISQLAGITLTLSFLGAVGLYFKVFRR